MQRSRIRPAVNGLDAHAKILRRCFAVLHEYIETTVVVENTGVQKFGLLALAAALSVFFPQPVEWVPRLRIFVEILHVGVGRSAVEIKVILFRVFP